MGWPFSRGAPGYLWATILSGRVLGINDADGALTRALARRMTGNLDFSVKRDTSRALSGEGCKIGPDDRLLLKGGIAGRSTPPDPRV